jgi:hypothetical protein
MLDLTDPMVYEMADRDHIPHELVTRNVGGWQEVRVTCEFCGDKWPCPTRQAIRALPPPKLL